MVPDSLDNVDAVLLVKPGGKHEKQERAEHGHIKRQ